MSDSKSRALDISEEKTNQLNGVQRVDDALEAQRVTEHFIDMVSHELRTPMSAMLQSAEMVSSAAKDIVGVLIRACLISPLAC